MAKIICTKDEYDKLSTVLMDNPEFLADISIIYDIVEAEPVKHGRCVIDNEGYERCSVCNEHETGMRYFTFCPRCGVKLNGGTE